MSRYIEYAETICFSRVAITTTNFKPLHKITNRLYTREVTPRHLFNSIFFCICMINTLLMYTLCTVICLLMFVTRAKINRFLRCVALIRRTTTDMCLLKTWRCNPSGFCFDGQYKWERMRERNGRVQENTMGENESRTCTRRTRAMFANNKTLPCR